jgi:hypothetical protein
VCLSASSKPSPHPLQIRTRPKDGYEASAQRAWKTGHSTPTMAGEFARRVGARRLVLTHFSARFDTGRFRSEPVFIEWVPDDMQGKVEEGRRSTRRGCKPFIYTILRTNKKSSSLSESTGNEKLSEEYPDYIQRVPQHPDFATKELVADARAAFGSDSVIAACDFMVLKVPRGGF